MSASTWFVSLKKHRIFSEFLTLKTMGQFMKTVASGLITGVIEVILLKVLTDYLHVWYILSNIASYGLAFWLNFLLNKFWSFESKGDFGRQLTLYTTLFIFNLLISTGLIYLLTDILKVYYLISKLFSMGMIVSWNFIIYKKIIYKKIS